MGSHRAVGRLKGSIGAWVLDRAFDAEGAEALSPAVDQNGFAAFAYEEVDVAARHAAVRRPRRPHELRAGRRDRSAISRTGRFRPACCCVRPPPTIG